MLKFVVAVAFAVVPTTAQANYPFVNGNMLHEMCSPAQSLCPFYVMGVVDGLTLVDRGSFCLPEGVNSGQVADVVAKYLLDTPEKRHHTAASLVALSLRLAFPC